MKIPLFDIDGTLVKTANPIHREAFNFAFKKVYNQPPRKNELNPEGMTDRQIIVEVLKLRGIAPEKTREKIKTAMQKMAEFFYTRRNDVNPQIIPEVEELLKQLKSLNIPMGVLTGNVAGIGWTKIERAGLRDYFDFGAFGDKTEVRVELVELARRNAQTVLNRAFKTSDFVIIGDTPKDIKCARDAGIKVIVVATGIYSYEDLKKEKPDLLINSFKKEKDRKKVINFLLN